MKAAKAIVLWFSGTSACMAVKRAEWRLEHTKKTITQLMEARDK